MILGGRRERQQTRRARDVGAVQRMGGTIAIVAAATLCAATTAAARVTLIAAAGTVVFVFVVAVLHFEPGHVVRAATGAATTPLALRLSVVAVALVTRGGGIRLLASCVSGGTSGGGSGTGGEIARGVFFLLCGGLVSSSPSSSSSPLRSRSRRRCCLRDVPCHCHGSLLLLRVSSCLLCDGAAGCLFARHELVCRLEERAQSLDAHQSDRTREARGAGVG